MMARQEIAFDEHPPITKDEIDREVQGYIDYLAAMEREIAEGTTSKPTRNLRSPQGYRD